MRFLIDECLSVQVGPLLHEAGHDAVHVVECGLAGAPDDQVLAHADGDGRILLSADTDFGEIPGPLPEGHAECDPFSSARSIREVARLRASDQSGRSC